jgi:energy-coupling factor transport system substrate-specific component
VSPTSVVEGACRARPAVRLHARSRLALCAVSVVGVAAFSWPLLLPHVAARTGESAGAPFVLAALLALLLGVVVAEVADGGLDSKALAMLGVLAAAGSVLRLVDAGTALTEGLVFFLMVPAGRALGRGFGFLLGSLTLFASALLTVGVGPWLPFQMLAAGWFGFLAACLPPVRGRLEVVLLAGYGFIGSLLYGLLMDLSFWPFQIGSGSGQVQFDPDGGLMTNVFHFWAFHLLTGAGWDLLVGSGTFVLVLLTAGPLLAVLRRASRRAAFSAPVEFITPVGARVGADPRPASVPPPAAGQDGGASTRAAVRR